MAMAACTAPGTAPVGTQVQTAMFEVQAIIALAEGLGAGIAAAVPGASSIMLTLTPWINTAVTLFQGMAPDMATGLAGNVVQQIINVMTSAVNAMQAAVNDPLAPPTIAALAAKVSQARLILGALVVFVEGVSGVVPPMMSARARLEMPPWVHR